MRTHGERSRHRRSVQLEFLENRSLLSQVIPIGRPTAEVQLVPPAEVQRVPLTMSFKGTWSASDVVLFPTEGVLLRAHIHIEAEGYAIPWGKFLVIEDHTFEVLPGPDASALPVRDYNGEATFTLGRLPGEKVTTTYTATGNLNFYTGQLDTTQDHQISGGTGRYLGYAGTFKVGEVALTVFEDNPSGPLTSTGVGTTSPPNGLKPLEIA